VEQVLTQDMIKRNKGWEERLLREEKDLNQRKRKREEQDVSYRLKKSKQGMFLFNHCFVFVSYVSHVLFPSMKRKQLWKQQQKLLDRD